MTYWKNSIPFLLVGALLLMALGGCGGEGADDPNALTTTTASLATTTTAATTTTTVDVTDEPVATTTKWSRPLAKTTAPLPIDGETGLPVYVPGSIQLASQEQDDYSFVRPYRVCFYWISSPFLNIVEDQEAINEWSQNEFCKKNPPGEEEQMYLVEFIKKFNITREQFDAALEEYIRVGTELGYDFTDEYYEAPDPDIIYTFDDEIIREYYRYE